MQEKGVIIGLSWCGCHASIIDFISLYLKKKSIERVVKVFACLFFQKFLNFEWNYLSWKSFRSLCLTFHSLMHVNFTKLAIKKFPCSPFIKTIINGGDNNNTNKKNYTMFLHKNNMKAISISIILLLCVEQTKNLSNCKHTHIKYKLIIRLKYHTITHIHDTFHESKLTFVVCINK